MADEGADWESIGFILASEYRRKIFFHLDEKYSTPTDIALATWFRPGHVSDVLMDLRKKGLVECKNPNIKKGRLYAHTNKGKEIMAMLKKIKNKS